MAKGRYKPKNNRSVLIPAVNVAAAIARSRRMLGTVPKPGQFLTDYFKPTKKGVKRPASRSNTKTKRRKTNRGVHEGPTGDVTNSLKKITYKKDKGERYCQRVTMPFKYESFSFFDINTAQDNTNQLNTQITKTLLGWYTGNDVVTIFNQQYTSLKSGNVLTGSLGTNQGIQQYQNTFKTFLQNVKAELEFKNQTPATTILNLYLVMSKQTGPDTDPIVDWNDGLADISGKELNNRNYINAKPTQSRQFNQRWKIVDSVTVEMPPGRTHRWKLNFSPNRIVDTSHFDNNGKVKGITYKLMAVARGSLADQSTGLAVGTKEFTPVKIIGFLRNCYTSRILSQLPGGAYWNNSLGSVTYTAGSTIVSTMNDVQGDPENLGLAASIA